MPGFLLDSGRSRPGWGLPAQPVPRRRSRQLLSDGEVFGFHLQCVVVHLADLIRLAGGFIFTGGVVSGTSASTLWKAKVENSASTCSGDVSIAADLGLGDMHMLE